MSVFRDIEMEYEGQTYTVTPSNRLLRRIEAEVSIMAMFSKFQSGKPVISELAFVIAVFLNSANAGVTEDEVAQELNWDLVHNNGDGIKSLMVSVSEMVTPVDKVKKPIPSKAKSKA